MLAKTLIILGLICLILTKYAEGFLVKTFGPDGPKYVGWGFFIFMISGVFLVMRDLYKTNKTLFFLSFLPFYN